jgi:phospholipid transport system transporter-binding protein
MTARLEARDNNRFAVIGALDLDTAETLLAQANKLFPVQSSFDIDLGGVTRSDSTGVALLVEWLRQARSRGQGMRLFNIPPQMQAIIKVTDLDELLFSSQNGI